MVSGIRLLSLLGAALVLAACASEPRVEQSLAEKLAAQGYVLDQQVKSISNWNLNGWTYVDDRHFIMHSGVRDRYLVALRSTSMDLRSAVNIAFSTTVGNLTDKDKVIVRAPGNFRDSYLIDSLHRLKKAE